MQYNKIVTAIQYYKILPYAINEVVTVNTAWPSLQVETFSINGNHIGNQLLEGKRPSDLCFWLLHSSWFLVAPYPERHLNSKSIFKCLRNTFETTRRHVTALRQGAHAIGESEINHQQQSEQGIDRKQSSGSKLML